MKMSRHNRDPSYVPMFRLITSSCISRADHRGDEVHFEGGTDALPGIVFTQHPHAH